MQLNDTEQHGLFVSPYEYGMVLGLRPPWDKCGESSQQLAVTSVWTYGAAGWEYDRMPGGFTFALAPEKTQKSAIETLSYNRNPNVRFSKKSQTK